MIKYLRCGREVLFVTVMTILFAVEFVGKHPNSGMKRKLLPRGELDKSERTKRISQPL